MNVKRPAFQFYPADWRKDVGLRACSVAARGLWIDMLCLAHECEPYGHLVVNGRAMTPAQIAGQVGLTPGQCSRLLAELIDNGVARRLEDGTVYSKRMVEDEDLRNRRAEGGKAGSEHGIKGAEHGSKGGRPPKSRGDTEPPFDGGGKPPLEPPHSSSSSSSVGIPTQSTLTGAPAFPPEKPAMQLAIVEPAIPPKPAAPPDCPHGEILALWAAELPALPQHNPALWRGARAAHLRARWRETAAAKGWRTEAEGIEYLRRLFRYVAQSRFLTGRAPAAPGRAPFVAELAWLVAPENWAKTVEGKYHSEAA